MEALILEIAREIADEGGQAWYAGGYVRDRLLGRDSEDYDVEVYGLALARLEPLLRSHGTVRAVGRAFGVLKFVTPRGEADFSIPRRENKEGSGHRGFVVDLDPTITPEEACSRRDFTVNAMLMNVLDGRVLDFFGGRRDLERRVLEQAPGREVRPTGDIDEVGRRGVRLNGMWDRLPCPMDEPASGEWETIRVPGVVTIHRKDRAMWVVRRFALPEWFEGRRALLHFGAVCMYCEVWLNGRYLGSHAGRGWGGGIYSQSHGYLVTLAGNQIVSNIACTDPTSAGDGGGVYLFGGEASLVENQIINNLGHGANDSSGGGMYLESLTWGEVLSNVIQSNVGSKTTNGYGSGLYVSSGRVRLAGNLIEDNWSHSGHGGGLDSAWSDLEITANRIISNTSRLGGGMYIRALKPVTITNNLIAQNDGGNFGGGACLWKCFSDPTQAILANNTIVDNGPDGVATSGSVVVTMTNNLLAGNPVGISTSEPASLTLTADTNLFWNGSDPITGTNAILADPLFAPGYYLHKGSPAIDAGVDIPWLTIDLDGVPRPLGGYDIGAYEGAVDWDWGAFLPLALRNAQ